MIGRSVGKYRILDRLGRGGMGTVYRAIDDTLQREVAIKVLNADVTEPETLKRFRVEAITLAKLHHPSIAMLYELREEDGELMMVMEFVHGQTLQRLADKMGPMPPDFAAQLCAQALDGLAHAHRAGIVHRDLKPGNIMVTDEGVVKVMDFGIARIAGSEHLTSDGLAMGTPAYMAPEQILGQETDSRSDIYAMGIVLYSLWTGQPPFHAETPIAIAHKQVTDLPTPLNVVRPNLPVWCDAVLARALAKDPADRFQTAQEFRAALLESAKFTSLEDVATMTMATPRAVMVDPTGGRAVTPPWASTAVRQVATAPVTAPTPAGSPTGTTLVISSKQMFTAVGTVVLVLILVGVGAVIAIRRGQTPAASPSTPPTSTAQLPVADSRSANAPKEEAARPAAPAPPAEVPTSSPVVGPASKVKADPATAARGVGTAKARDAGGSAPPRVKPADLPAPTGAAKAEASNTPPASSPTPASVMPAVRFDKLKLLIVDGDKAHEEDAELQFADGQIVIYAPDKRVVAAMPYAAVHVSSVSRSKQPRWRQPSGALVQANVSGGPLGFIKSDRTWIGIATQKNAYVFRVDESRSEQLSATITERTGIPVVRLK
jgi:eukaryotic-like serine/threonine-protein kinase